MINRWYIICLSPAFYVNWKSPSADNPMWFYGYHPIGKIFLTARICMHTSWNLWWKPAKHSRAKCHDLLWIESYFFYCVICFGYLAWSCADHTELPLCPIVVWLWIIQDMNNSNMPRNKHWPRPSLSANQSLYHTRGGLYSKITFE